MTDGDLGAVILVGYSLVTLACGAMIGWVTIKLLEYQRRCNASPIRKWLYIVPLFLVFSASGLIGIYTISLYTREAISHESAALLFVGAQLATIALCAGFGWVTMRFIDKKAKH